MVHDHQIPTEMREWALSTAYKLIDAGVPVFKAERREPAVEGMSEFILPKNWQNTTPSRRQLTSWKPNDALCAVTGVKFDVIDVDPRNDGDASFSAMQQAGLVPPTYGAVQTPSGGVHLYVPIANVRKGEIAKGVDYQAGDDRARGRGFVYIPPTMRFSKVTGKPSLYKQTEPIDVEAILENTDDPQREPFLHFVKLKRQTRDDQEYEPFDNSKHTDRETKYLAHLIKGSLAELAQTSPGMRDNKLNSTAYYLGRVISGCGLDEGTARELLIAAGLAIGLAESRVRYVVNRSISEGKLKPVRKGPFLPEGERALSDEQWKAKRELDFQEWLEDAHRSYL